MKGNLIRIASTNNNLRTKEVEGEYREVPTVGKSFVLIGEPLDPTASFRMIKTSPVTRVWPKDRGFLFKTENSTYELNECG